MEFQKAWIFREAFLTWWLWCGLLLPVTVVVADESQRDDESSTDVRATAFLEQYCLDCHNDADRLGGLTLEFAGSVADQTPLWERIVRRLSARQMPPASATRPTEIEYHSIVDALESRLDRVWASSPDPGRTATFRRLTRSEYQNAVRDLMALEIDATSWLPRDESSLGFDNITVGDLSPTLLNRYVSAAQHLSHLAVGSAHHGPSGDTFRLPADRTQEEHVEGLPLGTRGGTLIHYVFPQTGEYQVDVRLARDRNEQIEGLHEVHELEILVDRERRASFTVRPPQDDGEHQTADQHLKARIRVSAGPHDVGVTFLKQSSSLQEIRRQPFLAHFNMHRHPRLSPAVFQVSILGPFEPQAVAETPSRQRIFVCSPSGSDDEEACVLSILRTFMRRAYRRPITEDDLEGPLGFYRAARATGDFESGIEAALASVLVSPHFLFRIERDPESSPPGTVYHVTDVELASRLSFFLWSSIPDDQLLASAIDGELRRDDVLKFQVQRMLQDPRADSLTTNFAAQWLHLRNLDGVTPDLREFPDFDDNLRQAMRRETELLFQSVIRDDRSVLDLLKSDYTFLNERLAKHYGVPHVYGDRFRRVELDTEQMRGGVLRHASILTVTSYATRTSPVIRGKWVMENLLGTPPPPPPANVPALEENNVAADLPIRQRLAQHRADPACASCHKLMDPVGFALENYDAVGRWRAFDHGTVVDASGGLPDGQQFMGVSGLEDALLDRPELFVRAFVEKLLTFALGRELEPYDAAAVRGIMRQAAESDYCFSSLILGVAQSVPFQMRRSR